MPKNQLINLAKHEHKSLKILLIRKHFLKEVTQGTIRYLHGRKSHKSLHEGWGFGGHDLHRIPHGSSGSYGHSGHSLLKHLCTH